MNRAWLPALGAALLLHGMACVLGLAFVRVPPLPVAPEDQTVTLLFEPPQAPPEAALEAPAPTETPSPPEAAVEPPAPVTPPPEAPPPEAPPPPRAEQLPLPAESVPPPPPQPESRPAEPPKPMPAHHPVHKPMAQAKPAAPARAAEPPAAASTETSRPARPAQPAAEAPISADWQHSLAAWLAAHKVYPELARRRGVEGNVALQFTADRSGRVLSVSVLRSAGSAVLDAAAEAMVRDATLPPFPAGMAQKTASVTVTIHYALAN